MSVSFGAQTGLVLVDARPQAGRCFLPLSASLLGRTVTIKDQFGVAAVSSIQIITNSPDTFEDGTSSRWISHGYGFMTIAATASNVWTVTGGTRQPAFHASTISTFLLTSQTLSTTTAAISQAAFSSLSAATATVGSSYISTLSTTNLAAPSPFFSTVRYLDTGTGIYTSMSLSSSYIYINNTAAPIIVPWQQLSTVAGLGTAGYVSTLSLTSSIAGLGTAGYVSTSWFQSTLDGLGTLGFISTTEDTVRTTSTVTGLGTIGYVSAQQGLITISSLQTSSIAASLRGVQFLLAGSGSLLSTGIFYSQDGTTGSNATLVPNIINYYDAAVASNGFLQTSGGTEYVLTADLPNRLYVSSNLTSWLPVTSTPTATAKSITFGSNAGVPTYIATTAAAGAASIQYRRNIDIGFVSITTAGGFSGGGSRAAYNPATDRWVAAGVDATASTLQYTTNLTTWTASAGVTFSTTANSIIWAPGFSRFYAVGKAALSTATIKMSADGITWSNATTGGFANCNIGALDIAYGNVGGTTPTLVAVGEAAPGGSISTIQWSTDGLNFSNATAGGFVSTNFAAGTAVAYSATLGRWMAAGGTSSILTSADGKAWVNAAFQRPVGFTATRIFAPNTSFYTTLPIIAGPEALFQAGRQIVDTGYLNTFLATKSFGTSTFSTLTVAQTGTIASLLVNSNGSAAPTSYGLGVDTLTLQTTNAGYAGGIASMAFATGTAAYPLARIYAVDSASSGPANSQLVFQTVPLNSSSFSSNYSYVGSNQTFTVPAGVTTISVAMWGAGGGGNASRGGAGAYINGTLSVTPGQLLTLVVGQGGLPGQSGGTVTMYGGGGNVPNNNTNCGAGGGRSAIQTTLIPTITSAVGSGTSVTYTTNAAHGLIVNQPVIISGLTPSGYNGTFTVTSPGTTTFVVTNTTTGALSGTGIIVAELVDVGGGGGSGDFSPSQGGNATYSGTAVTSLLSMVGTGAAGGSQTAGGAGGTGGANGSGSAGSLLKGGSSTYRSGGGGGGYYGGGGGSGGDQGTTGGGGGSSYTSNPSFTLITGSNSPDGFTAPATTVSGYQTGSAAGGALSGGTGGAGLILLASIGNAYAEAMRIGTTGNVGIGTAAPAALLDVAGTTRSQTLSSLTMNASTITLNTATLSTANVSGSINMSFNNISSVGTMFISRFSATNTNATMGGTYSTYISSGTTYALHAFTNVGTTNFTPNVAITGASVLLVGGGGGGGSWIGGGGGGGYITFLTGQTIAAGSYQVIVGAGGIGALANRVLADSGTNGGNTSAFGFTALGGGVGGTWDVNSMPITGGGSASGASNGNGQGGYGAGLTNAPGTFSNGANGIQYGVTGSLVYYSGGGGGAANVSGQFGIGGLGGGGTGANQPDGINGSAATFYGGGGGGGTRNSALGGAGFQGVAYLLYALPPPSGVSIGSLNSDAVLNMSIVPVNTLRLQGPTEWRSITSSTAASVVDLTSAAAYFATTYRLSAAGSIAITFPTLTKGAWWVFTNVSAATQTLTTTGTTTGLAASYSLPPTTSITFYSDENTYYTSTTGSTSGVQAANIQAFTF